MQPPERPVILSLKFPATILQISAIASHNWEASSSPHGILEAMLAAASLEQRILKTPQSDPAIPTIAETSPSGESGGKSADSNPVPAISKNTSWAAARIRGFQLSSGRTRTVNFSESAGFIALPPKAGSPALSLGPA